MNMTIFQNLVGWHGGECSGGEWVTGAYLPKVWLFSQPIACCRVRLPFAGVCYDNVAVSTQFWLLECIWNCCLTFYETIDFFYDFWWCKNCLEVPFPLEKGYHVTSAFTLLSYFCIFCYSLVTGFGRTATRKLKTLRYLKKKKKPIYWFLNLSFPKAGNTWSCFGDFLCCYRAATKWNWPAAVTLFFATVPMLRICSLLSCKLGQGQKQVSHPMQTAPAVSLSWPWPQGMPMGTKAKGPDHHTGVALILNCSQHQILW
jgi:hypothetical protein